MLYQPFHHTIVATDVVGSSSLDDHLQLRMRSDLRAVLSAALHQQGLVLDRLGVSDLGDGFRLQVPASVSPLAMLDPFIPNLTTRLRLHRKTSSDATRLRLRVAVHMGLLHHEPNGGWAGGALAECARLLDAPAVRNLIAGSSADLVVVVSSPLYEAVLRPGYGLDPDLFRQIPIQLKETDTYAWAYLPGASEPTSEATAPRAGTTRPARHPAGQTEPPPPPGTADSGVGVRVDRATAVILTGDGERGYR